MGKVEYSAYVAPLVTLPVIITAPGKYVTRGGDTVEITSVTTKHNFDCWGVYSDGVQDHWHKSGRIYPGSETKNDIVGVKESDEAQSDEDSFTSPYQPDESHSGGGSEQLDKQKETGICGYCGTLLDEDGLCPGDGMGSM